MVHIGYYLHFPPGIEISKELILSFQNNRYQLFFVPSSLIPCKYKNLACNYYDLSMPVLFKSENQIDAEDIIFLSDIPIIDFPTISNSFYILSGKTNPIPILQYSGKDLITLYNYSEQEQRYIQLFIEAHYIKIRLKEISEENFKLKQLSKEAHKIKFLKDIEYILNIDISKILSTLSVNVWSSHRCKIGGDDSYSVYKDIDINDKSIYLDPFLKELINIGHHCILKESGYTSYFPHPEITFGEYKGLDLENERNTIKAKYSKAKHLYWYFQANKKDKPINEIITSKWEDKLSELNNALTTDFFNVKSLLKRIDQRFFLGLNRPWDDSNKHLEDLNNYLNRIQFINKTMRIIISGHISSNNIESATNKIHDIIDDLIKDHDLTIVTGNAIGAEQIALNYALSKKISFENGYTEWTMLGADRKIKRYEDMTSNIDLIILIGDKEHYLYSNFTNIGTLKNIKIHYIEDHSIA